MNHDTYCSTVCKARCCYLADGAPCPYLTSDNRCEIYQERFAPGMPDEVTVALYTIGKKTVPVRCVTIAKRIRDDTLPLKTALRCCYANPIVLEGH